LTADEREAHHAFVATLGESAIWCEYLRAEVRTPEPQVASPTL
jgi:hypothetical protein